MAAPTLYRSDDASAPVLSYGAGTLIAVLDACLVNGYGAKSAAGWAKTYSGTNKAAYKMGTGGTSRRMFLRVEDSVAQWAQARGYDDMTDVDTGTEPFPTVAQFDGTSNNGMFIPKSSTGSGSVPRAWWLLATPTAFYFQAFVNAGSASAFPSYGDVNGAGMFFGEYPTLIGGGFTHNVAFIAGSAAAHGSGAGLGALSDVLTPMRLCVAHYACRGYAGSSGAVQLAKYTNNPIGSASTQNSIGNVTAGLAYPDPVSGKLAGSRVYLAETGFAKIGRLPGLWSPNYRAGNQFDTIDGSGAAASRTLLVLDMMGGGYSGTTNVASRGFFDTTDLD